MHCYACEGNPPLAFDQDTRAFALPTWTCAKCGRLYYDARRFEPVKVKLADGFEVYVRRGAKTVQAFPFPKDPGAALPSEAERA